MEFLRPRRTSSVFPRSISATYRTQPLPSADFFYKPLPFTHHISPLIHRLQGHWRYSLAFSLPSGQIKRQPVAPSVSRFARPLQSVKAFRPHQPYSFLLLFSGREQPVTFSRFWTTKLGLGCSHSDPMSDTRFPTSFCPGRRNFGH